MTFIQTAPPQAAKTEVAAMYRRQQALTLGRSIDVQGCLRLPDEPTQTHGGRDGH
jgi:hypothetical protein